MDEQKNNIVATPIVAGSAIGASIASNAIRASITNNKINSVKQDNYKNFIKKLKPGDIITMRSPKNQSEYLADLPVNIKTNIGVQAYYGKKDTHAAMYTGRGKIIHAIGHGEKVELNDLKPYVRGKHLTAIRPSNDNYKKALSYARAQVGKPYTPNPQKELLKHLATGSVAFNKKCDSHICTSLTSSAYKNTFKSKLSHPMDAVSSGKASVIARYGKANIARSEGFIARNIINPSIKGLRWAVPATIVAATANAISNKYSQKKDSKRNYI